MVKAMSPTSWHLTQCLHSHLDVYTFPPASFIANELSPYFMAIREFFWSFKIFDANWWSILVVFFWHLLDVCRTSIVDVQITSEHRRPTDVWKLSWTVGQYLDVHSTSFERPLHTGEYTRRYRNRININLCGFHGDAGERCLICGNKGWLIPNHNTPHPTRGGDLW